MSKSLRTVRAIVDKEGGGSKDIREQNVSSQRNRKEK